MKWHGIDMHIVPRNMCTKFHLKCWAVFELLTRLSFLYEFLSPKKGHNWIIIKAPVMRLSIYMSIISRNMCTKFHLNICNSFWVVGVALRLKFCDDDAKGYHESQIFFSFRNTDNLIMCLLFKLYLFPTYNTSEADDFENI